MDSSGRFDAALDALFGDGISKKMDDRQKRAATAGLNAVGATAGAAGLGLAATNLRHEYKAAPKALGRLKRIGVAAKADKFAAGLLPLEVAGLGGELMATKILHADAKKPKAPQKITKSSPDGSEISTTGGTLKAIKGKDPRKNWADSQKQGLVMPVSGQAVRLAANKGPQVRAVAAQTATGLRAIKTKADEQLAKSEFDFELETEISKVDTDKRQVFGWASIVEKNGQPVVDLQGDYISVEEIEKAAYTYVQKSRKGGNMHRRNGDEPLHVSDMIESFVVTPEKKKALGLPEEMPLGWWTGYQIHDDDTWADIKSGKRTAFSIHGRGRREVVN